MRITLTSLAHHRWLATVAMLVFALRALIPVGFMPGGSGALTLQVCPDGFPAALLGMAGEPSAHAGHHHHHAAGESSPDTPPHDHQSWSAHPCAFSAVAGAPPLSHSPIVADVAESAAPYDRIDLARLPLDIRFRIAQPRAPPPHLA
jgi:hypothetical protein